jgi:hypothetical protein
MKKLLLFLLLPLSVLAQTKPPFVRTPDGPNIITDYNLKAAKYLIVPISNVSGIPGGSSVDSAGYLRYNPITQVFQGYFGNTKGWADISPNPTITGGIILTLPIVGAVIPTGTPDQVWNAMYRPPLPPTAALSGGTTRQFTGTNLTHNLSWTYGRQATTASISTAVITPGSFNVFGSQPSQPGTVTGSQSVTTTANLNTTYTLTVTGSDGKVTTATTADNWSPFLYVGTCAGTTPTSAEVLAATTKGLSASQVYSMNFTFSGSNLHVFYAYYSAYTTVTSVKDAAGNQAIAAMTLNTVSITDNGFSGTWKTATTNNTYSNANIVLTFQ